MVHYSNSSLDRLFETARLYRKQPYDDDAEGHTLMSTLSTVVSKTALARSQSVDSCLCPALCATGHGQMYSSNNNFVFIVYPASPVHRLLCSICHFSCTVVLELMVNDPWVKHAANRRIPSFQPPRIRVRCHCFPHQQRDLRLHMHQQPVPQDQRRKGSR